jgi:hypothetical protein
MSSCAAGVSIESRSSINAMRLRKSRGLARPYRAGTLLAASSSTVRVGPYLPGSVRNTRASTGRSMSPRGPAHRDPPARPGHPPVVGAVPVGGAVLVVLTFGPATSVTSASTSSSITSMPIATDSPAAPGASAKRTPPAAHPPSRPAAPTATGQPARPARSPAPIADCSSPTPRCATLVCSLVVLRFARLAATPSVPHSRIEAEDRH